MLPIIATYEMTPAATKNTGAFTNNATNFDVQSTNLGVANYLFADFVTSAADTDFGTLQLLGSEDNTNFSVIADFAGSIIAHGTSQTQLYRVGLSPTGPNRRYLKWNAVAGTGTNGITGYGRATVTQMGIAPTSISEWQGANSVYISIL